MALTATATEAVRRDISTSLRMENPTTFELPIVRRNLYFDVVFQELLANPIRNLVEFLDAKLAAGGCSIVYCRTKAMTDHLCRTLNSKGRQCLQYHADLPERNENQSRWMRGEVSTMVATIAFGLGVDKGDVRAIVHWGMPSDMSSYFQEAGRGGRDGNPSWCRLYFSGVDRDRQEKILLRELNPSGRDRGSAAVSNRKKLTDFRQIAATVVRSDVCRHAAFDEALESLTRRQTCGGMCDHCFDPNGLAAAVGELRKPRRFPLLNQRTDDDEPGGDAAVCPMAEEVRRKCTLTKNDRAAGETESPSEAQEGKRDRKLGKRRRNIVGAESDETEFANVAEYFHTCGHCEAPNQRHIMNHLTASSDCLAGYCRSVRKNAATDPPERKMVFELALQMGACLNPDCRTPHYGRKNLKDHVLNGACRPFHREYTGLHWGATWSEKTDVVFDKHLVRMAKRVYRETDCVGSSALPNVSKTDRQRREATERQQRWRQARRLEGVVDSSLAVHNMMSELMEILRVPCSVCRWPYSRPRRNQSGAAIVPLESDDRGEVPEHLRSSLGGPKPEEHLRYDGQFWICSVCRRDETSPTRYHGNLELYQSLQDSEKFTLRAVGVNLDDERGTRKSGVILTPSQHPTPDTDGEAATLSSDVSWKHVFVMIPADMSDADEFSSCHPSVQTTDWQNLAKLQAIQGVLPGIFTLANVGHNCHRAQVQRAKIAREQKNETKVFGMSRVAEDGRRKLDVCNISQRNRSTTESVEQQDEDATKEDRDFVGALKDVAGSADYFEAREKETRARVDTFGAVRLQLKQKIFDGVDGKVGSRLINPALAKFLPLTDGNNRVTDFQCFLRCSDDGCRGCGEDCDERHANLDDVSNFADPNFVLRRLPLLARYVSACADCFVRHIVQERVRYYDFWLQYEEGCVFLVGNVWLKEYEDLNADIASNVLTGYVEVAEKIEKINVSSARPLVPTATLDEEVLSGETRGAIKNLQKVKENVLTKQIADELQGPPSLVSFFPRHKGRGVSTATKENAAHLVENAGRERPDAVSLEAVLENVSFRRQPDVSEEKVKFAFRIESLTSRETITLFFAFLLGATTLEVSGEPVLELCRAILAEEEGREKKRFETAAPRTALLLYDALQAARNEYESLLEDFGAENIDDVRGDIDTLRDFATRLGQRLWCDSEDSEDWREIEADRGAVESLKATLELQLGEACSEAQLFYHTALDLHQASSNEGFTLRRSCKETRVRSYEAFSFAVFGEESEVRLLLPGDDAWTVSRPSTVDLCGIKHFQMPVLQLALLKSGGKASNRFSNCGQTRFVDLRNGENVSRSYRELSRDENVGQQQVWENGGKRYVLADGWRSYYMMLPEQLSADLTFAELCAWYDRSEETPVTVDLLRENQGFLAPEKDAYQHERILKGENRTQQRDALLPSKILLKNDVTVLSKRKSPVALQWESLGLDDEFHEKALFTAWQHEEGIHLRLPSIHVTDVWRYYFTGELTTGAPRPASGDTSDASRPEDPSVLSDSSFRDSRTSFPEDDEDFTGFAHSSQFVTSTPVRAKTLSGQRRRPLR